VGAANLLLAPGVRCPWAPRVCPWICCQNSLCPCSWKTSCCPWVFSGVLENYWI